MYACVCDVSLSPYATALFMYLFPGPCRPLLSYTAVPVGQVLRRHEHGWGRPSRWVGFCRPETPIIRWLKKNNSPRPFPRVVEQTASQGSLLFLVATHVDTCVVPVLEGRALADSFSAQFFAVAAHVPNPDIETVIYFFAIRDFVLFSFACSSFIRLVHLSFFGGPPLLSGVLQHRGSHPPPGHKGGCHNSAAAGGKVGRTAQGSHMVVHGPVPVSLEVLG